MPKKTLIIVCIAMILSFTGLTSGQLVDFPDITEETGSLLKNQKDAIESRIGWWKSRLLIADTVKLVGESCKKLMKDYARVDNRVYKNFFVTSCVKELLPLLDNKGIPLDDKLRNVKIIKVASLLSQLRDRAILPALKSMSVNKNPAVRLFAWEGYKKSRYRLITSRQSRKDMLESVEEALKTEKSPIVLQGIYRLMNFRGVDTGLVSETTLKEINDFFLKILSTTWNTRRLGVMDGKVQKINRATDEVPILGYLGSVKGATKTTKTKVLQMLLDMSSTAAEVYDRTIGTDPKVNKACEDLLLGCEQNLNSVAEMQNQSLVKGLISKVAPGAAVQGAIFTWSDALEAMGVKAPQKATPEAPAESAAVTPAITPKEKTE